MKRVQSLGRKSLVILLIIFLVFSLIACDGSQKIDENSAGEVTSTFRNNKNIDTESFTVLADYEGIEESLDPDIQKRNLEIMSGKDDRANLFLDNFDQLSIGFRALVCNNPMAMGASIDIFYDQQDSDWWRFGSSIQTESPVTMYLQWDRRWANEAYGESILAVNGCAPTCLAMIFDTLKIRPITPKSIIKHANPEDITAEGTTWDFVDRIGNQFGISSERIPYDYHVIINQLNAGNYILASVGPGEFTFGGHFIVIADYDENGFIINDPYSYEHSIRHWSFEEITPVLELWSFGK
ncbi:MAG: hypothetical protein GX909_05720 [Clostridiaceae bacterium]|nr:hypothetical protein [Clostridiaceae bacterium]